MKAKKMCIKRLEENEERLTKEDIEKSEKNKAVILHECIHAIFRKSEKECKKRNLDCGSGLFEAVKNGDNGNINFGEGFNEGLTDWIVEKAGLRTRGYEELTKIVKELELALGAKKIMKSCRTNEKSKAEKNLKMNLDEYILFMARTNQILLDTRRLLEYELKLENARKLKKYDENEAIDNSKEKIIKKLEKIQEKNKKQLSEDEILVEKDLFDKYFYEEFQNLMLMPNPPYKNAKKFFDLAKLLDENNPVIQLIQRLDDKYMSNIFSEINEKIKNNKMTFMEMLNYNGLIKESCGNITNKLNKYYELIGKNLFPECPEAVVKLMQNLERNDLLVVSKMYSIAELETTNHKDYLYFEDGRVIDINTSFYNKNIEAGKTINNPEKLIDFTVDLGEELTNIVNQFLELKGKIAKENPNSKIIISNRAIIVDNEGKKSYYYIANNQIMPATVKQEIRVEERFAEEKNKDLVEYKKSIFSKIKSLFIKPKKKKSDNKSISYKYGERSEFIEGLKIYDLGDNHTENEKVEKMNEKDEEISK